MLLEKCKTKEEVLEKCKAALLENKALRQIGLDEEEKKVIIKIKYKNLYGLVQERKKKILR